MNDENDPLARFGSSAPAEKEAPAPQEESGGDPLSRFGETTVAQAAQRREAAAPTPRRWQQPAAQVAAPGRPAPAPVSTAEDIAKAAGSGIAMGALADIPGFIGSAGQLYDVATQKLGEIGERQKEAFGFTKPGTAAQAIELARKEAQKGKTQAELAGDVNKIFGVTLPTAQGMEKTIRGIAPDLSYAPQTRAGKLVASTARALPSGVLGGGAPLLTRVGMAGASGLLSEAAGQAAEGTQYETAARLAGAVLGPAGYNTLKNVTMVVGGPGKSQAQSLLMEAIAKDIANGSSKMNTRQLQQAIESGALPGLWNMGGIETRKLISKLGYRTAESQDALEALNSQIASQAAGSNAAMRQHIAQSLGVTEDAFDLKQAIRDSNQGEISRLYDALRTDSAARSVASPALDALSQSDVIQRLAKRAESMSTNPMSRIIPPTQTRPGNVFYWDQIKRDLDDEINEAFRNGRTNAGNDLRDLRKYLVSEVDSAVPNYKLARDAASESLGFQNAVEAGYKSIRGAPTSFKIGDALKAYNKYTPDRQDMFRQGLAAHFAEIAEKGGADDIIKILEDPNKRKLAQQVLGNEALDSLTGRATAESVMNRTRAYGAHMEDPNVQQQFVNAQIIYDIGPALFQAGKGNFGPLVNLMATKAVTGGTGFLRDRALQKQANHILGLMNTTDPAKLKELGRLINKVPATKTFIGNFMDALRNVMVRGTIGTPPSQEVTAPQETQAAPAQSSSAPRSVRNNNPGNLEASAWTQKQPGYVGTDGRFAIFESPEAGERATESLIANKLQQGLNTPRALINTPGRGWDAEAPPAYAEHVARRLGIGVNDPIDTRNPQVVKRVLQAIREFEGGTQAATGGRIERASGGRVQNVDALVDELMGKFRKAKKETDKTTEPLLNAPDEHIVKALDVAQQAI
jgi:hypothetical protein